MYSRRVHSFPVCTYFQPMFYRVLPSLRKKWWRRCHGQSAAVCSATPFVSFQLLPVSVTLIEWFAWTILTSSVIVILATILWGGFLFSALMFWNTFQRSNSSPHLQIIWIGLCFCFCRYRYADEEVPKLLSNLSSWVVELSSWQRKVVELFAVSSEKEGMIVKPTSHLIYILLTM